MGVFYSEIDILDKLNFVYKLILFRDIGIFPKTNRVSGRK